MKKIWPILTGFTFAAGILVGGYIVSIVLDKSLNPPDPREIKRIKKKTAEIRDADDISEEEAEELYEVLSREIDEEVLKEFDEDRS